MSAGKLQSHDNPGDPEDEGVLSFCKMEGGIEAHQLITELEHWAQFETSVFSQNGSGIFS